jgi:hypothetical protein
MPCPIYHHVCVSSFCLKIFFQVVRPLREEKLIIELACKWYFFIKTSSKSELTWSLKRNLPIRFLFLLSVDTVFEVGSFFARCDSLKMLKKQLKDWLIGEAQLSSHILCFLLQHEALTASWSNGKQEYSIWHSNCLHNLKRILGVDVKWSQINMAFLLVVNNYQKHTVARVITDAHGTFIYSQWRFAEKCLAQFCV